jgi:hypothetical protein
MNIIETANSASRQIAAEVRELNLSEIEFVSGGSGSNSTTYQGGGSDGYGGGRRNP